jgi:outer membrane protein assembly factor BamB
MGCLVSAMAVMPSPAIAEDWPMFHHDLALSGYTPDHAPQTNEVLWTYQTGASVDSSPAVAGDSVFVGSLDGHVYSLDKWTGALNWTYNTGASVYSSPAVWAGKVYVLSSNGTIYALNAATGALIWNVPFGTGSWDWSSPAVHGDSVFIGSSQGSLYSLDKDDGSQFWSRFIGGTPDSPIAVVNGLVYSGTHNFGNGSPTLVAVNEGTGTIAWTYDYYLTHGGVTGMVNSNGAAVVDSDGDSLLEVHFGVYNWNGTSQQAVCLSESTGTEIWAQSINGNSTSTPAIHNGQVFIGSDDWRLYALNAVDGSVNWSFLTGGQVWTAPAVSGDGKVCFGSLDHTVYCVDEGTGALIWSYYTGASRLVSSPAISDGVLYIGNENGKVYAFGRPCPEEPDPLTQGYWHRQCLGAGLISPGRNGRGPQTVPEPDFEKTLVPAVDARLQATIFNPETYDTCEDGIDANPPSDKCEKALKQYTAMLLNLESGRIGEGCQVDLTVEGCVSTNIGDLVDELAGLINSGETDQCRLAADCAGAVNEGEAIVPFDAFTSAPGSMSSPMATTFDNFATTTSTVAPQTSVGTNDSHTAPTAGGWATSTPSSTKVPQEIETATSPADDERPSVYLMPAVSNVPSTDAPANEVSRSVDLPPVERSDARRTIDRHLTVLANMSSTEEARRASEDALLTALGGGYEPGVRLQIVRALTGTLDAAYDSLLMKHLEDIRIEAEEFGSNKVAAEATKLLKRFEP